MKKIKESFQTITFRQGGYSLMLTIVVLGIVIAVNLLAGKLPQSIRQIDISDDNIYEITDTSRDLLKDLDKDVSFTVLADKNNADERIRAFIDKYAGLSDHIKTEWVDPVLHPSALTEYDAKENSIVVSCKDTDRTMTVSFNDIIVYDQSSYYMTGTMTETEFDGEGQLTSAVNYVTSGNGKTIYTISGQGESTLPSSVTELMEKSGFETKDLNLLMDTEIPKDCDMLFQYAPTKDISEDELKALVSYMEDGGKLFLLLGDTADMPNLSSLLKTYGLQTEEGYVADMQRCYQGNYYYIFPELSVSGDLGNDLSSQMVLLMNAHGLTETDPARDTITTTPFMKTSSDGYLIRDEDDPTQGTYVLGAVATEDESRLTVISADSLIDENVTSSFTNIENLTLFMNAVTANFGDMENLSIEAKSLQIENNTMKYTGWIGLAAIIGIPVIFLLYGLRKWMKRRKA